MIEIRELQKRFGRLRVLNGLDLEIERSRVTAIVGPNGAGKTTLIKILLGLTRPDAGEVHLMGHRINGDPAYKKHIGYMPQAARFPENLTAREVIAMLKDLRGNPERLDEELLNAFCLDPELDKPLRTLSGGNRQKVSATLAFLFHPEVLILDEPSAGLDPVASGILKDKIRRERDAGKTIILTSHIMSEIEELADHLVFLLDGKVKFDGPTQDLTAGAGESRLERAIAHMMNRVAA